MKSRLSLALLLLLAACTYTSDPRVLEGTIIAPGNFKAGSGQITSVGVLRGANKEKSGPDKDPHLYRLYLNMDKTGAQAVDIDNSRFMQGEFVELTNDGRVVRISGTELNELNRR